MRKVIFQNMVSLDGFFEGPNKEIDWHNVDPEFNHYAEEFLDTLDTLIFGRVTYQLMASYWPTKEALIDDPVIAKKMNDLQKVVFSRTLKKVDWNNSRLAKNEAAAELKKLKKQPGKDIAIFGSSDLSIAFIEENLIDEFRLIVNPIVLGAGKHIFQGIENRLQVKLIKSKAFKSGNVLLCYEQK